VIARASTRLRAALDPPISPCWLAWIAPMDTLPGPATACVLRRQREYEREYEREYASENTGSRLVLPHGLFPRQPADRRARIRGHVLKNTGSRLVLPHKNTGSRLENTGSRLVLPHGLFARQPADRRVVQSEMATDFLEGEVPGLVRGADGAVAVGCVGDDSGQALRPPLPLGHLG